MPLLFQPCDSWTPKLYGVTYFNFRRNYPFEKLVHRRIVLSKNCFGRIAFEIVFLKSNQSVGSIHVNLVRAHANFQLLQVNLDADLHCAVSAALLTLQSLNLVSNTRYSVKLHYFISRTLHKGDGQQCWVIGMQAARGIIRHFLKAVYDVASATDSY